MTTEERFTKIENALHSVSENQSRHDAAIRDLIVISRTLVNAQMETTTQIQQLAERSAETEEKLHALIEIVDRIIRKKGDN